MLEEKYNTHLFSSSSEMDANTQLLELFKTMPIPAEEMFQNLGMFLSSKALARILFFTEIYKKIVNNHGVIMEFGTRWGQTVSLLSALRGIFEPFNRHRKIIGFDTFEGFKGVSKSDGEMNKCTDGSYSVTHNYEEYLEKIMWVQEQLNPMPHIKKFELVKGDVCDTVPGYLKRHPETIVSLAIFDMDIYTPTKVTLENIKPYLAKGSIVVFDELCEEVFPGETVALREVFEIEKIKIQRLPYTSRVSYFELE